MLVMSQSEGLKIRGFAIAGDMLTRPWLELNDAGSLVVIQGNKAIGRKRWESRTVISFREGEFVVVGYDYVARDTLDMTDGTVRPDEHVSKRSVVGEFENRDIVVPPGIAGECYRSFRSSRKGRRGPYSPESGSMY